MATQVNLVRAAGVYQGKCARMTWRSCLRALCKAVLGRFSGSGFGIQNWTELSSAGSSVLASRVLCRLVHHCGSSLLKTRPLNENLTTHHAQDLLQTPGGCSSVPGCRCETCTCKLLLMRVCGVDQGSAWKLMSGMQEELHAYSSHGRQALTV